MNAPETPTDLLGRWRHGDEQAATKLFELYSKQLTSVAARTISDRLAGRVDGEDVVQSVFRTFFRRTSKGEFTIKHSGELWQLLVKITVLKARSQARQHTAAKRDVGVERAIGHSEPVLELMSREPGPQDAATLWDEIDALLDGLPDRTGQILAMRLEGSSKTEIADELQVSRQTVHRLLKLLRDRLAERLARET